MTSDVGSFTSSLGILHDGNVPKEPCNTAKEPYNKDTEPKDSQKSPVCLHTCEMTCRIAMTSDVGSFTLLLAILHDGKIPKEPCNI